MASPALDFRLQFHSSRYEFRFELRNGLATYAEGRRLKNADSSDGNALQSLRDKAERAERPDDSDCSSLAGLDGPCGAIANDTDTEQLFKQHRDTFFF